MYPPVVAEYREFEEFVFDNYLNEKKILEIADYYEFKCRQVLHSTGFRCLGKDFRNHKNWIFLERIYKLKEIGYDPFVMIYDKPNAPKEIRKLQRWVNNKFIFRTCDTFDEYMKGK